MEKIGQLCQSPMLEYADNREVYLAKVSRGEWGSRILADTALGMRQAKRLTQIN
ncbi:hypothetical protein [Vibrio taketomensis]|uniref:hypothetical protein n=1 Tax=Vibrio taketomensis TaxID=2572923 RepID=UPI001E56C319|nr:hypothetical protein [Vibrio taketomensis]